MAAWHILIVSLPTRQSTARMRVWRSLKALGCGVLRDGVYLLPAFEGARATFERQSSEVIATGGQAQVLSLDAKDADQESVFRNLFDRSDDYAAFKTSIEDLRGKLKRGPLATLARESSQLQKTFTALAAIDYFPGPARDQMQAMLNELAEKISAKLNPGEPHAAPGQVKRLDRAQYQGRTWATRKHLWVDRMASAWLIARCIDADAKFKWLAKPEDCPRRALGFDFDNATFTHIGQRVTFEVLVASFGLEEEAALMRIGGIVHYLDVGGVMPPEALGLEAVLKGLRETAKNDDALLAVVMPVFDGLYVGFKGEKL